MAVKPNPGVERDCAKARSPSLLRWAKEGQNMALFTPRGLKIRMAQSYAFALMARLFPTYDAFRARFN
jgi:hypothetical protein